MKPIHAKSTLRLVVAMLITVAVIALSTVATYTPAQNQSSLTLKSIRTDTSTTFYADQRTNGIWFVEAVLPTGDYANNRANGIWFVEAVLPTGDSNVMTENLNSVAATL
jgi:hypothetical protein